MFSTSNMNYEMSMINLEFERLHREAARSRLLRQVNPASKSPRTLPALLRSLIASLFTFRKVQQH